MASTSFAVTSTPTAVTGLSTGANYNAQNTQQTTLMTLTLASGDAAAVRGDPRAAYVPPLEWFSIRPRSGQTDYVWYAEPNLTGTISIHEIPST